MKRFALGLALGLSLAAAQAYAQWTASPYGGAVTYDPYGFQWQSNFFTGLEQRLHPSSYNQPYTYGYPSGTCR